MSPLDHKSVLRELTDSSCGDDIDPKYFLVEIIKFENFSRIILYKIFIFPDFS